LVKIFRISLPLLENSAKNAVIARSFFCYKKKLLHFQFLSIVKAWKLC